MSRGDWFRYSVVALGLIAYALMFVSMGAHWSQKEASAEQYARQTNTYSGQNIADACGSAQSVRYGECVAIQRQAQREDARAEYDLAAQRGMGDAAWWMVFISAFTFLATAIGVWFVKRTLDATLEAVKDTGEATIAMQRQNKIAEDTAQRQLRAYVSITDPIIGTDDTGDSDQDRFSVNLKNSGQTPASVNYFAVIMRTFENNILSELHRHKTNVTINIAGAGSSIRIPISIDNKIYALLESGYTGPVIVHGLVSYKDIFNIERTTKFSFATDQNFWDIYPKDFRLGTHHRDNEIN